MSNMDYFTINIEKADLEDTEALERFNKEYKETTALFNLLIKNECNGFARFIDEAERILESTEKI